MTGISEELTKYGTWADGKDLYDQMHRLAWSLGLDAVVGLTDYLKEGLYCVNNGLVPSSSQVR